jgi:hypothetical protein
MAALDLGIARPGVQSIQPMTVPLQNFGLSTWALYPLPPTTTPRPQRAIAALLAPASILLRRLRILVAEKSLVRLHRADTAGPRAGTYCDDSTD